MSKILKITEQHNLLLAEIQISEANLAQSNALKAELATLTDQYRKNIVVDFNRVEYVDSSFLGALVSALKYAVAAQTDISVVNLKKDIRDLFGLIRLDKVFKIYNDHSEIPA